MSNNKKALISVWDKSNLEFIAKFLFNNGYELISTGGTAKTINSYGLPVTDVSKITNQKEVMNGRVKTLHPKIFGGILADRDDKSHIDDLLEMGSTLIDIVVINLYPFKSEAIEKKLDLDKAIEFIDIGGPSMLRAAAKNYKNVLALSSPRQYESFVDLFNTKNGEISVNDRLSFAKDVFRLTFEYDMMIGEYLNEDTSSPIDKLSMNYKLSQNLRYGENPHQKSSFYIKENDSLMWEQLHGKELSYNNYFDIESAISIVYQFDGFACSIIKHANPCGFGIGENNFDSYMKAVSTDPISFFGGIVAFNNKVDDQVADEMNKSFLECIVAPEFSKDAVKILKKKKNLRLLTIDKNKFLNNQKSGLFRSVFNGILYQEHDKFIKKSNQFEVKTRRVPTKKEFNSLLLGWKLVKFVKSNAIVFSNNEKLLGVGAGQMSRIDSVKIAISKANENDLDLSGSIMASDAFFPFSDGIELAAKNGICGVVHPGGSINDQSIIDLADKLNLFMVFTKERHFYH